VLASYRRELRVRPAVEGRRGYERIAGLRDVEDREHLRRLTARQPDRRDATLERGHPLLEDVGRRVHDPGVDVPEFLKPEQPRRVVGVVEGEARRLVDGDRAGVRSRRRLLPCMDLQGLETVAAHGACSLSG
jgi:hypothetical protein